MHLLAIYVPPLFLMEDRHDGVNLKMVVLMTLHQYTLSQTLTKISVVMLRQSYYIDIAHSVMTRCIILSLSQLGNIIFDLSL